MVCFDEVLESPRALFGCGFDVMGLYRGQLDRWVAAASGTEK
jgi:hypothetical protein